MKKTLLSLILAAPAAFALEGLQFQHEDWEIACDNTGTCRAAGYQNEDAPTNAEGYAEPVSLLLTREAGENAAIKAQLQIIPDERDSNYVDTKATLILNGKTLGTFTFPADNPVQTLNAKQTQALLAALPGKKAHVVVKAGTRQMTLSDKGAAAVLLKMDEFQKRLDTPSALIKKGNSKHAVLAPVPAPQIKAVIPPQDAPRDITPDSSEHAVLLTLFREDFEGKSASCELREEGQDFTLYPLGNGRLLTESFCWLAAYNAAGHYAIVSDDLTTVIAKVRGSVEDDFNLNDYNPASGELMGYFKGRGLGDCWHEERWRYDGERFVQSFAAEHGMCRGFPGGAWEMPTLVKEIIN
ncbi:MAG: DUF1176 domain-containing protein [Cardiobacteriaceae bacterium]|nr:DUF1176 domain-containing protein [Cardiobacteriaceae bacterium]